jgi:ribulose-5-phosphate 4-epimerase/fuculose-1-phosphate aldolase
MSTQEGVTQFRANHTHEQRGDDALFVGIEALAGWRTIFAKLGLIGQDPDRYDGAGFGNVSVRCGPFPGSRGRRPFWVSGTQTGGDACVSQSSFCLVQHYDLVRNSVTSRGPLPPSSESLTHGSIYDLGGHIRSVIHVHSPIIWTNAKRLGLPRTADGIGYGTTAMAREMSRLCRESTLWERRVLAMTDHEDGVIAFGKSVAEAANILLVELARAHALRFVDTGVVCGRDSGPP